MDYNIKLNRFRRFFTLPCCIAEKYLKIASGDQLKVLLYILSSDADIVSSDVISKATGVDTSSVDDAIIFWEKDAGVLCCVSDNVSLDSPVSVLFKEEKSETKPVRKNVASIKYPPTYIKQAVERSDDLKMLMDSVQAAFKRTITYTEENAIINLYEYYGFPANVILILIDYCNNIGKTNVHYIEKVAQTWNENGIMTHEAAEAEVIRLIDKNTIENQVRSSLGLTSNLTPNQKKFIENWNALGLSVDMITYASEKSIDNTGKIAFPYMNRILTNWADNGYKTRDDVLSEQKAKDNHSNSTEHSYDLDEFYKMAINYTPNDKGE